jgi:Cu(I)/Ag(I) efflux system membrane protein CusA/SilA
MTSATTILALLPVLSSTGRGSDIMIPMAIPTFGGMAVASLTWFVVPILYCWAQEWKLRFSNGISKSPSSNPLDEGVTL